MRAIPWNRSASMTDSRVNKALASDGAKGG